MEEKKIKLGGREFEIVSNFRKSNNLVKYRNKYRYGSVDVTEENKEHILEVLKLQEETPEGSVPDISKLSPEALIILQKMSDDKASVFDADELIDMGSIILELSKEEVEELYNIEMETNGYDDLATTILYALTMVFTSANDGSQNKVVPMKKKTQKANQVAKE